MNRIGGLRLFVLSVPVFVAGLLLATTATAQDTKPAARADVDYDACNRSDFIFVGKVVKTEVAPQMTEIRHVSVFVTPSKVYRGKVELGQPIEVVVEGWQDEKAGLEAKIRDAAANHKDMLFLANSFYQPFIKQTMAPTVAAAVVASPANVDMAATATALPIGWIIADGKPLSPWAQLGASAWPKDAPKPADKTPVCGQTGRPAYTCGEDIELRVEKQPEPGMVTHLSFIVRVTNTGKQARTVEPLRTDGHEIMWSECVLIINNGHPWYDVNCHGIGAATKGVVLQPGESVETVITLRHCYADMIKFCVGELSQSVWFNSVENMDLLPVHPPLQ